MILEDLGAVALDRALGLLRRDVIILAVDEHDDVGVLLDRARFAQIRQLRALVLALLDRAAELRQRHHRHVHVLGQGLEASADLGDFLHAAIAGRLGRPGQQLEIVDHHQPDLVIVAPLQPAHAGVQCADRQAGGVVDEQRQVLEIGGGGSELVELGLADLAHAQRLGRNPRLLRQNARGELVGRHFEAEERHLGTDRFGRGDAVAHVAHPALRGVEGDVGGERRLAHAGAAGEDHQIAVVHAADLGVDRVEAGGDARQIAARVERSLRHLDRHGGGLGEGLDRALGAAVGRDLEQLFLGGLDLRARIDLFRGVHRALDQPAPDRHQRAQHGEIIDLLGELPRADQAGARAGQLGEVTRPAQFLHALVGVEHRAQRDRRRQHVVAAQRLDRGEDAAVHRLEEVIGLELVEQIVGQPVVDHHRAEHRRFRLDILRQRLRFGCLGGMRENGGHGALIPFAAAASSALRPNGCGLRA